MHKNECGYATLVEYKKFILKSYIDGYMCSTLFYINILGLTKLSF